MARVLIVVLALAGAACAPEVDYATDKLELEVISPAVGGGGEDVFAAFGPIIFTQGHISKDGGATWRENNAAIIASSAVAVNAKQLVVRTTAFGIGRWDMDTDQVLSINSPYNLGNFHVRQKNATLLAGINGGSTHSARQLAGGQWSQSPLPQPPAQPPPVLDVSSFASNDLTVLLAATWGVYRSIDDGVTWTYVFTPASPQGQELLALPDGRFLLFSPVNQTAAVLDTMGMPTGVTTPAFPQLPRRVACLGVIVAGDKLTRDLGQTWEPLVPGSTFQPITVSTYACTGTSLLVFIKQPTPLLVPISTLGKLDPPLVFSPAPAMVTATKAVFASDGTVLAGNLAWKEGDPVWSLRILPDAEFFALGDGSLFGVKGTTTYRSRDSGATFTTATVATLPPATRFFATPDHTLWASRGELVTTGFAAKLWRSDDDGATWSMVFDKLSTYNPDNSHSGIAPELVAIADDGTFVAKAFAYGLYVSHDRGATWTDLPFPDGFALAFVTHAGNAVTFDPNDDPKLGGHVWHEWRDYGLGNAYRQVTPTMGGMSGELGTAGTVPLLDAQDRVYLFGGGSLLGVFRSTSSL